jgi:hypothetical protein
MHWKWLLLLPFFLNAQNETDDLCLNCPQETYSNAPNPYLSESFLYQAEEVSQKFSLEVAKLSPPSLIPQPQTCLNQASIWFTIDLSQLQAPAFEMLNDETLWDHLRDIGVQAVFLKGLKKGGQQRTGMGIDPKWGSDWNDLALCLQKKGITLIGESLGASTGVNIDFGLALKNYIPYQGLYHLIEIEKKHWKLLPTTSPAELFVNVPWLTLQELHKRGYVPEKSTPYVKKSSWNATGPVKCADGKVRRWIYLTEEKGNPAIDWLNPSFAGSRIAAADTLDSIYNLGQKIIWLDDAINWSAKETQALWIRKLSASSVLETKGALDEWKKAPTDLISDTLTRPALLHALIAEDAEVLKLMYRLFLEEGIEVKRLVHSLQPFDAFRCDWALFLADPRKRFQYYEEMLTGEALRMRLLKQDIATIGEKGSATWPSYCLAALGEQEKRDDLIQTHLLLALFYAMQPGAFSFSVSDLLGLKNLETVDLLNPNEGSLYGSLSSQMKNSLSFANQLKQILLIRKESAIENGELLSIPETKQKGLFLALHRIQGSSLLHLLAINFSKTEAQQTLEIPQIRQTTAIDLMTQLAEKKPLNSSTIQLNLPPLSGKVILFQPKYYD